jgi:DNA-binding MarR family transcriptional regulator
MLQTARAGEGETAGVTTQGMYRRRDTRREQLVGDIIDELRSYSVDAQHIGHAFAGLHGLNATDLHALIAVMEAERAGAPITPGRLGERLNLSSGSVTALVDRLERAGHIRRDRDTGDRRKVFLRYADQGAALASEFFRPLGRRTDRVMAEFTDGELETVRRFLAVMTATMREHRDQVRAARRPPG